MLGGCGGGSPPELPPRPLATATVTAQPPAPSIIAAVDPGAGPACGTALEPSGEPVILPGVIRIDLPESPAVGERFALGAQALAQWVLVPRPGQMILTDGLPGDRAPGERWQSARLPGRWSTAALSQDGRVMLLGANHGPLMLSRDGGESWQRTGPANDAHWTSVAVAPGGCHQAASSFAGRLWVSRNRGQSWEPRGPVLDWMSVAISEGGHHLVAVTKSGELHASRDGGETWTVTRSSHRWQSVANTPDGAQVLAGASDGALWQSDDFGEHWWAEPVQQLWSRVAISHLGDRRAAATWGEPVQVWEDERQSWTSTFRPGPVTGLAMSADGQQVLLTVPAEPGLPDGRPHLSTDGGRTWQAQLDDRLWSAAAVSADATTVLVTYTGADGGGVRWSIGHRTRFGPSGAIYGSAGGWLELEHIGDGRFVVTRAGPGPYRIE